MALAEWNTNNYNFEKRVPYVKPMDPRTDKNIALNVPLFRQITNKASYSWLLSRFEFLPKMLGNWVSPYYGTDKLLINKEYHAVYPDSAPVGNYSCKMVRLLLLEEIEEALLHQDQPLDDFFLQKIPTIQDEEKEIDLENLQIIERYLSYPSKNGKFPYEAIKALDSMCSRAGKHSLGKWYALTLSNKMGEIIPYKVWYSYGPDRIMEILSEDDLKDIQISIKKNYQVGTAFGSRNSYDMIHQKIQKLLKGLSKSLIDVYQKFSDSYDDYLDDNTIAVYNPYKEMPIETRETLKQLIFLVDTFNRPQNPQVTAPRIEEEWEDAINYKVFGIQYASVYFNEDTRNWIEIDGKGRIRLLSPNKLDAARVRTLQKETGQLSIILSRLANSIDSIPNVAIVTEYENIVAALSDDLKQKVESEDDRRLIRAFRKSYRVGIERLKDIQKSVNNYFKQKSNASVIDVMLSFQDVPNLNFEKAKKALEYQKALEAPAPVLDAAFQQLALLVNQTLQIRKSFKDADSSKAFSNLMQTYNVWEQKLEKFTKVQKLKDNEFADADRKEMIEIQKNVQKYVRELNAENLELEKLEKQQILDVRNKKIEEITNPYIDFTPDPLRIIRKSFKSGVVSDGPVAIASSNFKNPNTSCPYDSFFSAFFKLPGSWLEQQILKANRAYVRDKSDQCRRQGQKEGWTHADELHQAIVTDMSFAQNPDPFGNRVICKTRQFWSQCFNIDNADLTDDPRALLDSISQFYQITDKVVEIPVSQITKQRIQNDAEIVLVSADLGSSSKFQIPLKLENSAYTLFSVFIFDQSRKHWTTVIRDPRSKKWFQFDGIQEEPIKLQGKQLLPKEIELGIIDGNAPLGWIYFPTKFLDQFESAGYRPLIEALKRKNTERASQELAELGFEQKADAYSGLYATGLMSEQDYARVIIEFLANVSSQEDVNVVNRMISFLPDEIRQELVEIKN